MFDFNAIFMALILHFTPAQATVATDNPPTPPTACSWGQYRLPVDYETGRCRDRAQPTYQASARFSRVGMRPTAVAF